MNEGSKKRFISARDVAFLTVPLALAIISGMAALYGRAAGFSTDLEKQQIVEFLCSELAGPTNE